jgi:hypothetical protein
MIDFSQSFRNRAVSTVANQLHELVSQVQRRDKRPVINRGSSLEQTIG